MTLKNKREKNVNKNAKHLIDLSKQKQTANFHWLWGRGCKQRHLSMELSGKRSALRFDVI